MVFFKKFFSQVFNEESFLRLSGRQTNLPFIDLRKKQVGQRQLHLEQGLDAINRTRKGKKK